MTQKMLTVREVSELISVSEWSIRQWVNQGKVPGARKFGNAIRIPESFVTGGTAQDEADRDAAEAASAAGGEARVASGHDYDPRDRWPAVEPVESDVEPVAIAPEDDPDDSNDEGEED